MSTSSPAPTPNDYFSLLPDELLIWIFDLVGYNYVAPPLNKRLYRFYVARQYPSLYRSPSIKASKLPDFARSLSSNSNLGPIVTVLNLRSPAKSVPKSHVARIKLVDFARMFDSLTNLVELSIEEIPSAAEAFLRSDSNRCGPNLESLTLVSSFDELEDPFENRNFVQLANRSRLSHVQIKIRRAATSLKHSSTIQPFTLTFPAINSLVLEGPLSSCDQTFCLIAGSQPKTLELRDTSSSSNLAKVIGYLPHPELVQNLTLEGPTSIDSQDLRKQLVRFTGATSLELTGSACGIGAPFYNALRKLPIKNLTFGHGADVSATELVKLVSGQKKHSTLTSLTLDNIYADTEGEVRSEHDHDWIEPVWTRKFSEKGLGKVREAARLADVNVSGEAFEATMFADLLEEAIEEARERAYDSMSTWERRIAGLQRKHPGMSYERAERQIEEWDERDSYRGSYGGRYY